MVILVSLTETNLLNQLKFNQDLLNQVYISDPTILNKISDIKYIYSDLDGTLLHDNQSITALTQACILYIKDKYKIEFGLCSGRIDCQMTLYSAITKSEIPLISCNGALLRKANEQILFINEINKIDASKLSSYLIKNNIDFLLYTTEAVYYPYQDSDSLKPFIKYNENCKNYGQEPVKLYKLTIDNLPNKIIKFKILCTADELEHIDTINNYINNVDGLEFIRSSSTVMDIMKTGTDKGSGLLKFCELYNCKLDNIIYFGDHLNDLSALTKVGMAVTVDNAEKECKDAAQIISVNNNDDGLAYALIKIFNINISELEKFYQDII